MICFDYIAIGITETTSTTSATGMNANLLIPIISALSGLLGAIIGAAATFFINRRVLKENRITERKKAINAALNEFYGPLHYHINVSNALYRIFVKDKPKDFRTLTYLLNLDQLVETPEGKHLIILTESDKKLLEEIIDVEKKIDDIVTNKGGLVEDDALMFRYSPDPDKTDINPENVKDLGLLAIALTHFRIFRLAYEGSLKGEVGKYKDFVYPQELNDRLNTRIRSLQKELKDL
jgi:hypothetical protein